MLTKIKKYLADKYECDVSELDKSGLNIISNNKQNRIKMLLLYDLVLVSSSSGLYEFVSEKLNNKNIWCGYFSYIYNINYSSGEKL